MSSFKPIPKAYERTIAAGSNYGSGGTGNHIVFPGVAVSWEITNNGGHSVLVKLNEDSAAVFTLASGERIGFNKREIVLSQVNFANNISGATLSTVRVVAGIS